MCFYVANSRVESRIPGLMEGGIDFLFFLAPFLHTRYAYCLRMDASASPLDPTPLPPRITFALFKTYPFCIELSLLSTFEKATSRPPRQNTTRNTSWYQHFRSSLAPPTLAMSKPRQSQRPHLSNGMFVNPSIWSIDSSFDKPEQQAYLLPRTCFCLQPISNPSVHIIPKPFAGVTVPYSMLAHPDSSADEYTKLLCSSAVDTFSYTHKRPSVSSHIPTVRTSILPFFFYIQLFLYLNFYFGTLEAAFY